MSDEDRSLMFSNPTCEQTTRHLLRHTRPTLLADRRRALVIDFVQRLIRASIGCEVFPYGSVPLKTYLPDGDIDLTVLCSPNIEDALVSEVLSVLKAQELDQSAQFQVKDVHCIVAAEVKLVKCIVQNIVVDISFNQIGGLCTLCFLEQVDCLVGKDHLFKRSIILIKAWCYYESRILGSHHGLISTYALEILVLYIFHQFHSSLSDPLTVLYKFLDYFSKFDWENYCVSLNGPVCKASLPEIVVDISKNGGENVLLCEEFLNRWMDVFSVPLRGAVINLRGFPKKYLNIFDPLKENNNLGRSVNRGNFYRICSAFKYGACELGRILSSTGERMADDLKKFFANTIERHVSNDGMKVQCHTLAYGSRDSDYLSPFNKMCFKNRIFSVPSAVGLSNGNILDIEVTPGIGFRNEAYCLKAFSSQEVQKLDSYANVKAGSSEASNGFASFTSLGMRSKNASSDCFSLRTYKGCLRDLSGISRGSKASESLLDLSGDYDSHFKSLLYGQSCLVNSSTVSTLSCPETICDPIQLEQNDFSQTNANGAISGVPQLQSTNYSVPCNHGLGSKEKKKLQWTGSYFPRMNYRPCKDRPSQGGIRYKTTNSCRNSQSNSGNKGAATISEGSNIFEQEGSNQTNTAAVHSPKAVLEYNDKSVVEHTYKLKDEYEFPPLSPTTT